MDPSARTAAAYVRWEQPDVPGWWDGWTRPALEHAIWEWRADDLVPYLRAVIDARPFAEVIEWFSVMLLADVVRYADPTVVAVLDELAESDVEWRNALLVARRDVEGDAE